MHKAQVLPDSYRVENVPTPKGLAPEVSAITFAPDGRLAVAMRRGTIQLFDPATSRWSKFAEGFHSPMGILSGKPGEHRRGAHSGRRSTEPDTPGA